MRFWVCVGGGPHPIEADDAEEAAEKAAERDHSDSGEPLDEYDATVLAPDGEVTRHEVRVEYSPDFYAHPHDKEPHANVVESLRRCAEGHVG